jgi:hypothetical protein
MSPRKPTRLVNHRVDRCTLVAERPKALAASVGPAKGFRDPLVDNDDAALEKKASNYPGRLVDPGHRIDSWPLGVFRILAAQEHRSGKDPGTVYEQYGLSTVFF